MNRIYAAVVAFFFILPVSAQNDVVIRYANTITEEDLNELLTILSADALEGRETGTRGQKMAAAFIVEEFKRIGLTPIVPVAGSKSYLQQFKLENYSNKGIFVQVGEHQFTLQDQLLFTGRHGMDAPRTSDIVFIKQGLADFRGLNLKNKAAIMVALGSSREELNRKAAAAYKHGAAIVVFIPFATQTEFNQYRRNEGRSYARTRYAFEQKLLPGIPHGYFVAHTGLAKAILGVEDEVYAKLLTPDVPNRLVKSINNEKRQLTWQTSLPEKVIETENVLGYLEGSDKKDELVVITAHFDHIGIRNGQINNGADDDGSGTSAVIELAEAFAQAKAEGHGPQRSMLFMLVTGEEKGLIGSRYYTDNPIFPLANTVVDLNIDMIGRHDEAHAADTNFVYLVGSDRLSSELHELSEKANATFTHLNLDYTYNDENHPDRIYYRSDHWNFAKNNIPVIFYFNGVHEDYHRPTDTIDKIEFGMLQKRAQLVFYTAWVVANRDQRIMVDKPKEVEIAPKR